MDFVTNDILNNVASGTDIYYFLTVGDTFHIYIVSLTFSNPGSVYKVFEGPTVSSNGTPVNVTAQSRVFLPTPTLSIYKGPTVTAEGVLLYAEQIGTSTTAGRGGIISQTERDELGFELNLSTNYLFKVTTLSNGTDVSTSFRWYESSV